MSCSQNVCWGCCHLKVGLGWRMHFRGASLTWLASLCWLLDGDLGSSPTGPPRELSVCSWYSLEQAMQKSKAEVAILLPPALEVTHSHFQHILLVAQTNLDLTWEGTTQRYEYQEVQIMEGRPGGQLPRVDAVAAPLLACKSPGSLTNDLFLFESFLQAHSPLFQLRPCC